jgi:hypothetical protein
VRRRLRPKYSEGELASIYAKPHSHSQWTDHIIRVQTSIGILKGLQFNSAADLSAGDASIINALDLKERHIGDYAPGYQYTGPIESTIYQIPKVDLFICSETLEHLDNPDGVLFDIRSKTKWLFVSTPLNETTFENPEHYWGWDESDIWEMLERAGFEIFFYNILRFKGPEYKYNYQMWVAK